MRKGFGVVFLFFLSAFVYGQKLLISSNDGLYQMIYRALLELKPAILTKAYSLNSQHVFHVLDQVIDDHPEIFYFDYKKTAFYSSGHLILGYRYRTKTIREMQAKLNAKIDSFLVNCIRPSMSEYEKIKAIHDFLVTNTVYDDENYKKKTIPSISYTAYGVLVLGKGVCAGYSRAFKLLCNRLGIESLVVSGDATGEGSGGHAWNIVRIGNFYYHIDVTWDDPVPEDPISGRTKLRYDYFLISDSMIAKDHTWDTNAYPLCLYSYRQREEMKRLATLYRPSPLQSSQSPKTSRTSQVSKKESPPKRKQLSFDFFGMLSKFFRPFFEYREAWNGISFEWWRGYFFEDRDSEDGINDAFDEVRIVLHPLGLVDVGIGYLHATQVTNDEPVSNALTNRNPSSYTPFVAVPLTFGIRFNLNEFFSVFGSSDWLLREEEIGGLLGDISRVPFLHHAKSSFGLDMKLGIFDVSAAYFFSSAPWWEPNRTITTSGLEFAFKLWF